jgi:uncharacterized protein with NAD-binding domain and iron-sulfur cluster
MRTIAVVGGGIAGVSCLQELVDNDDVDANFIFIYGKSGYVKTIQNYEKVCTFNFQLNQCFRLEF